MENNLLTALRKYRPTEGRDPLENFITEAFAWILKNYYDFSLFYLRKLSEILNCEIDNPNPYWQTQVNFNGFFPDLVCKVGSKAFVFEHKAWKKLHTNQLDNYRNYAKANFESYKLILITGDTSQHDQDPDLALCWRNIHIWISDWLNNTENKTSDLFIFKSFQNLLENEGMGPAAPISHEAILYFLHSRNFLRDVRNLIERVYKKEEATFQALIGLNGFKLYKRDDWGRIGIELHDSWRPCIFIGIMAEWEKHAVNPILGDNSPDFVVLLSFEQDLHDLYPNDPDFILLTNELAQSLTDDNHDWQFYNHLKDDSVEEKNIWHPLYFRKPMIEVFRGTKNADDQERRFMDCAKEILPKIINSTHFKNIRLKFTKESTNAQHGISAIAAEE